MRRGTYDPNETPEQLAARLVRIQQFVDEVNREATMENQHREIKGYRELNPNEIAKMNEVKELGAKLGTLVDSLRMDTSLDQRWVSIGATDLQQGLMALTRAIAKPTFF